MTDRRTLRKRVVEWILRYGPAELAGLSCAFVASVIARRVTHNSIVAAYAAAWGETAGYAGVIVIRDYLSEAHQARAHRGHVELNDVGRVAVRLLAEFGPAGIIDTFITRPLAMGLGVRFFGPILGLVVGKISADVIFYAPVIYMYERRRRH